MLLYVHLLGNDTHVQYGKIKGWYVRVIWYTYVLIYRTFVNEFRLLQPIHVNMWLQCLCDSAHALSVSFHIMQAILLCHLIGVICRIYMALDQILQISDALLYHSIINKNIFCTIRYALTTFIKPGTYRDQDILLILLRKVWYQIYQSWILWWKGRPVF